MVGYINKRDYGKPLPSTQQESVEKVTKGTIKQICKKFFEEGYS